MERLKALEIEDELAIIEEERLIAEEERNRIDTDEFGGTGLEPNSLDAINNTFEENMAMLRRTTYIDHDTTY